MVFDIKNFLNEESRKEVIDDFSIKKISVKKLHPSMKNFYDIDPEEIAALKNTIELVGIQENLVVREIDKGEYAGEYEIIAGHKRHLALSELVEEGKVTEFVPCRVDDSGNGTLQELALIFTNSTQRERSDYEKMHEIQRVRELLEGYSRNNDLPGRKRDIIAGILNTSKSTISRLDNIRRHMLPEFMEEYKAGRISTAAANEIAGASGEKQEALWRQYEATGTIRRSEAAAVRQEERPNQERKSEERHREEEKPQEREKQREPPMDNEMKQGQQNDITMPAEEIKEERDAEREEANVAYWGKETARELARFSFWLTEEELAVMQDIALRLKERAGSS